MGDARHPPVDRRPAASYLVTASAVYRREAGILAPWPQAHTIEELTEWLERRGAAYLLEDDADGGIWVHAWGGRPPRPG